MKCHGLAQCIDIADAFLEKSTCNNNVSENNHSDLRYEQIWKIIPNTTPKIIKRCSRCSASRFSSSDKFRINANKKLIDAWLIYKCDNCDATLKIPIINRTTVAKINQDLLNRLEGNDRHLAWYYAFTICQKKKELELDWDITFNILTRKEDAKKPVMMKSEFMNIVVVSDFFLGIPLFSVLRQKLGCSRSQIEKLHTKGALQVYNLQGQAIKFRALVGTGCFLKLSREVTVDPIEPYKVLL